MEALLLGRPEEQNLMSGEGRGDSPQGSILGAQRVKPTHLKLRTGKTEISRRLLH
jgi:hypothetical protein